MNTIPCAACGRGYGDGVYRQHYAGHRVFLCAICSGRASVAAERQRADWLARELRIHRWAVPAIALVALGMVLVVVLFITRSAATESQRLHPRYVVCDPGCDVTVMRDGPGNFRADCVCAPRGAGER